MSAWAHDVIAALTGEHGREAWPSMARHARQSKNTVNAVHMLGALGHEVGLVMTKTLIADEDDEAGA